MKKVLKRGLSIFLAITIIFSSAIVGFSEIDFASIDLQFNFDFNPFKNLAVQSEASSESDLTFTLNDDGQSYSVTDCDASVSGEIVIPSTYNGLPVTSIGESAFLYGNLTSIAIPNSVTSIGDDAFHNCEALTSITIPDSVTSIGDDAFLFCDSLTSVYITDIATWCNIHFSGIYANPLNHAESLFLNGELVTTLIIPECITSIGDYAFAGYAGLVSVIITDNVTSIGDDAFYACTSLKSVTIGNSVTSIERSAFEYCTNLTSVKIGDSVTSIADGAFYNCISLTSVYITDIATWCSIHFSTIYANPLYYAKNLYLNGELFTTLVIPEGVTYIGQYAFYGCTSLISATIPDGVTSIGDDAFYDCTSLKAVYITDMASWCNINFKTRSSNPLSYAKNLYLNGELFTTLVIPEGVTYIGQYAFSGCTSLISTTIPDGVTSIGEGAFYGCINLPSITIPDSVTSIGDVAFFRCTSLISITIPDGITGIGVSAFYNCSKLTSIEIPDSVTNIGENAFYNCSKLTSIEIPDSVTNIGENAFSRCTSLTSITIPDGVTSIGDYTFYGCSKLTSIEIPNSVTRIGEYAFGGCSGLGSITIGESVTFIDYSAFSDCRGLTKIIWNARNVADFDSSSKVFYSAGTSGSGIELVFGDSVKTIPSYLCYVSSSSYSPKITKITIGKNVRSIRSYAFSGCTALTSITISDSVTSIGNSAFSGCTALTKINWNVKNAADFTSSSSLFYNAGTAGSGIELVFGDSVESIPAYLCYVSNSSYRPKITKVIIGKNVTSIGNYAFAYCTGLTSVTIPNSVTSIGNCAFAYCTSLIDVYYCGTEADWANITIGSSNKYLTNATIHYNYHQHKYNGEWIVDVEPTCTETGIKYHTCLGCGDIATEIIPANGHSYSKEWTIDVAPTCTEAGSKSHHCTSCGDKADVTIVAPLGHNYSTEWTIDIAPTCTEEGSKSHHCTTCGDKADITVITATGHSFEIADALLTHPHTIEYKCSSCEAIKTETPVISDCVECNFTITAIDANSYKLVSFIGTETDVVIPATYNGRAVTTVGNSCFKGNTVITSVEIAEGVTTIGSLAFMNCASLEKVVIPSSITSIGTQAFYGFKGTIYCENGSVAHNYAVANNIKYVLLSIKETENTKIDYENLVIRTSVQNCVDITEILDVSEMAIAVPTASYTYGNLELYGTGTIVSVFDGDLYVGDFTLIVEGDTNGDSICDVLDVFDVERASNGNAELDGAYALAVDSNNDNVIDITDYQSIVNKATAS